MADYKAGELIAKGRTAHVFALNGAPDRVVKLFLPGFETNAGKEFGIAQLLARLGVVAPLAHETIEIDGQPGLVMDRVDGSPLMETLSRRPWTAGRVGRALAELHVPIHQASGEGLPSLLESLGRQIPKAETLAAPERQTALDVLADLPDGDRLCHGDFHPGNVLLGSSGPVTIDWTNVAAGPPLADVAKTVVLIRAGSPERASLPMRIAIRVVRAVLLSAYLRRYDQLAALDRTALRKWLVVVAAARLSESIANEQQVLQSMVRKGLRAI